MIQPLESLEVLNKRLEDQFGRFEDGRPNWKLVWSTDEVENRLSYFTKDGFELLSPVMMLQKKYPFDQDRYILEHLVPVSQTNLKDLTTKTSYEPLWTFQDADNNPTQPFWDVIDLMIRQVQINMLAAGKQPIQKAPYGFGNTAEECEFRAKKLMDELFGNDTRISDSLAMDTAVGYGTRQRKDWTN
jgi:hypothetical protein